MWLTSLSLHPLWRKIGPKKAVRVILYRSFFFYYYYFFLWVGIHFITRSTQRTQTSLAEADHYSHIVHCKNVEPWWWKTTPTPPTHPPPPPKKKKKVWIITCTTIWVCHHYYGVFCSFTHLRIPRSPPKCNQFFIVLPRTPPQNFIPIHS